jgi:hypothetical protein
MALNFNLLNTELPGQIATGAMRGYQGAQDRATELAQRQQQSQLNALKIAEAQRTEQSQNALNKAYRESVTPTGTTDYNKLIGSLAAGGVGEKIPAIRKAQTEQLTAQTAQQKAKIDLIDASLKQARSFLDTINPADPNAPALYMQWHNANHSDPVLGPELASRGVTAEQSNAQIQQAIAQGPQAFAALLDRSKLGTEKFMEMNKMTPEIQTMTNLGYPITQEGFEAYRQAQRPEQLSFEQRKELAREGRSTTPRAEPAPSIAQIEDPNNPGRMITIDARRYVPGTNVGVIGSSGKTTAAAKDQEKREFGKSQLQSELDNLRTAYATLETMRAIPSTERSGASNVLSSIAATGLGQTTGRVFGTEAQVERDVINSSKLRLMNAIKQATGISAQQLNSNVELQTMLKSLSDPSQATQTVDRIIESLEKQVKNLSATDKPKTPATPSAPANIDALLDKYK